jgi:cytochrome P450
MTFTVPIPAHVAAEHVFDFDLYNDPRFSDVQYGGDLHLAYAGLHAEAPDIFYTPQNGGHWMVTRFDDIVKIVTDPEHFSVSEMQIPRVENPPVFIPLSLDPPVHIPYRQALTPPFSPKSIRALEERMHFWADKLIDEIIDAGECDFIDTIASTFPVSIFMELMGMPLDRLKEFRQISDDFFSAQGDELLVNTQRIVAAMTAFIEEKKHSPDDRLITQLLKAQIDGRPISLEEMQNMCLLLFVGGMDTVAAVSGFAYRDLATKPELQRQLQEHPERIADYVDETIRMFGPTSTPRLVVKACELSGVKFTPGEMVICALPIGSRDERKTPNPNAVDLDRARKETLIFSKGAHLCVGHFLARAELRILAEVWLKRIPSFRLKEGEPYKFRLGTVLAPLTLPITWDVKQ